MANDRNLVKYQNIGQNLQTNFLGRLFGQKSEK